MTGRRNKRARTSPHIHTYISSSLTWRPWPFSLDKHHRGRKNRRTRQTDEQQSRQSNHHETVQTFITATGTRHEVKSKQKGLLPHTLITYPNLRPTNNRRIQHTTAPTSPPPTSTHPSPNRSPTSGHTSPPRNMADPTLVARARKTRYDNLPNFSGNPSDDAERFLKTIKNITKPTDDSTDLQFLEIVRGKLTLTAGTWFDDHEAQFTKWSDFETAFRNRYFSTTMTHTKFDKLTQRKQRHDESVTAYFDEIVTLCREVDPNMPDPVIIQHLMSGINPEFRRELSRRDSAMQVLNEFLKQAKIEQDLHDTFSGLQDVEIKHTQPFATYHLASRANATTKTNKPVHELPTRGQPDRYAQTTTKQSSDQNRNSNAHVTYSTTNISRAVSTQRYNPARQRQPGFNRQEGTDKYYPCRICGRSNHRSIDCRHRQTSGCYNCGENHLVHNCPKPPHFQ